MAKQKPAKSANSKPSSAAQPQAAMSRAGRIKHGREVIRRVNERALEVSGRRGGDDLFGGGRVQSKTRQKYRAEAIEALSEELGVAESEVEVCVQLAELAGKPISNELEQAILDGRLQLRKRMVAELLKVEDVDELEVKLASLLEDQI
jgi:hypothetical protein